MSTPVAAPPKPNGVVPVSYSTSTNGTVTKNPGDNQQQVNLEIPNHRFEIFQQSLLEHEYKFEDAFVSASLQRLHHGIYYDAKKVQLYGSQPMNVTFVAITFALHPMNAWEHRMMRAQIGIQAFQVVGNPAKATYDQPLRIVKFAPHLAYGRVSTENLHWTFSLGATIGIPAPASTSITPTTEYDRSKILGTMMKIQGSTRSSNGVQSSKLVYSMEENYQQAAGLPREFTFVFLVEQPVAKAPFSLQIGIKPTFSSEIMNSAPSLLTHDEIIRKTDIIQDEVGQKFPYSPFNFATMNCQFEELIQLPGRTPNTQEISKSLDGEDPPSKVASSKPNAADAALARQ
ncbi:hypothetical protein B7494_g1237 [Chlorociboria aeruginascens]|nr:hypothetical protein B7494_g1237 [Chlorociboria aeruginascens]